MRRVLVVDDDRALCEAITDVLEVEGWQVTVAGSGREALDVLGRQAVDVILLDFMMPEMSGAEFRAAQKARPEIAAIPVVLASAACNDLKAAAIDAAAVLTKPFRVEALIRCLDQVTRDPASPSA